MKNINFYSWYFDSDRYIVFFMQYGSGIKKNYNKKYGRQNSEI